MAVVEVPQSSFAVPGYRHLWVTGWLWHVARWMTVFATTYRVNEQTGDPLLVQLVGACFMTPMFLGGALAGTLTDRFDRHRTVMRVLAVLVPLSGMMGLAVMADKAPVGVSYAFVFCVGIGNVIDMTSRRSLAFSLVGTGLITNAAAFETFALHAGTMVGSLIGGAVVAVAGVAAVYLGLSALYLLSMSTLRAASRATGPPGPSDGHTRAVASVGDDLRDGIGLLRTNPILRRFLVTTVMMNFFYYAFVPLVPVFAEDLDVGPFLTGLLASAVGMGTMTGAYVIARWHPERRGLLHVAGALGAMTMLIVFANMGSYLPALAALFVAGLFGSGFGTTQSALVVSLVDEPRRGRALGALSMAIGALPFGMFSLGLVAQRTNPQLAVTLSVGVGIALLLAFHAARPNLRALT